MRTTELTRLFRLANAVLAFMAPILLIGAILLRNNEDALHVFGLAWFFLNFAILLALDERYRRRHEHDQ